MEGVAGNRDSGRGPWGNKRLGFWGSPVAWKTLVGMTAGGGDQDQTRLPPWLYLPTQCRPLTSCTPDLADSSLGVGLGKQGAESGNPWQTPFLSPPSHVAAPQTPPLVGCQSSWPHTGLKCVRGY